MISKAGILGLLILAPSLLNLPAFAQDQSGMRYIQIAAKTKFDRSAIANLGVSIEGTRTDSVWGFANERAIAALKQNGFQILGNFNFETGRGGHDMLDFPAGDAPYHNYAELTSALRT